MEIVKFEQFGLDEQEAQKITKDLPQILSERDVLSEQYNDVIKMDIEDPDTAKVASDLRKLIKYNRTKGVEAWHKANKDYFLRGGQFVDAVKRKEIAENIRMEDALEEIEKYQERKEAERQEELRKQRWDELSAYMESEPVGLSIMIDQVFNSILRGAKAEYEERIEAEKKAESERLELEKKHKTFSDREKEFYLLAPFASEYLRKLTIETIEEDFRSWVIEAKKAKSDYEAEQEKIRLENERLKKEREAEQARLAEEEIKRKAKEEDEAKQRAIEEAKKQAELDKVKAELEAERKRKLDEEIKREQEEEAKLKADEEAKKAPIKEKLTKWVDGFSIDVPDSELLNNDIALSIKEKFESFKTWAKKQII